MSKKTIKQTLSNNRPFLTGLLGFIVAALLILGIRFATYQPEEQVHYHANFAVYINGQREQFASSAYYVELEESCAEQQQISPYERAHMHDSVNDVVHVEDEAVTWGHFFQNIGWVMDTKFIKTHDQLLMAGGQNKISYILNGKRLDGVNRLVIASEDKLLVDYGGTSQSDLDKYYASISSTARKYNTTPDPASCGAGHTEATVSDRLRNVF